MFKHLLVPIDDSPRAQRAIDTAIGLALPLGARITAFIVEPMAPLPPTGMGVAGVVQRLEAHERETARHAEQVLQAALVRLARAGVAADGCFQRSPEVVRAIVDTAHERGCDLIVMATHVQGTLSDWLTPSSTKGVLAHAGLPLLVVH
jgi:nucleotide-binding universal stress UspA family protein